MCCYYVLYSAVLSGPSGVLLLCVIECCTEWTVWCVLISCVFMYILDIYNIIVYPCYEYSMYVYTCVLY